MSSIEPQAQAQRAEARQDPQREVGELLAHQAHRLSLVTNALLAAMKLTAGVLLVSPALV